MNQSAQQVSLKNIKLPIFFLQLGSKKSLFFDEILQQAALTNGHENIFILTDANFELYQQYNCINVSSYINTGRPFDKLYRHHSTNSYFFEKTCFDRWFIINDFIKDNDIEHFFYADCDVLILQDLFPIYQKFIKEQFDGTTMFFEYGDHSVTSAHTSFWNKKLLGDFCDFINFTYADEQAFGAILKNTLAGKFLDNTNVSDMILLDVFRTERKPNTLNILALEDKNIGFDFNINASFNGNQNHYTINRVTRIKNLSRRKNGVYGQVQASAAKKTYVKFYTLHFQGYLTKTLIPFYINHSNYYNNINNSLKGFKHYLVRRAKLLKNDIKAIIVKK